MQEIMVLESVTCICIGGRKVFAYYLGLTIFDCFLITHKKFQTMLMYLILVFAQKSQQQPGSRRSQEVEKVIWIDGSTNNKLERGGAGIFIEDKRREIEERLSFAAGEICSSFGAEGVAMLRALYWMELHPAETVICTDSLSVRAVLKKDNWRDCQDWTRKIKIQSRRVKRVCHNIMGAVALRCRQH